MAMIGMFQVGRELGHLADPRGTTCDHDQCILCCRTIYAHASFSQHLIPEILESVPHLLNFQPRNTAIWKGKPPQTLLCVSCCRIAAEGHQLLMLIAETQNNVKEVSSKLRTAFQNSFSGEHGTESDFVANQTSAIDLREDLVNCLLLNGTPHQDADIIDGALHSNMTVEPILSLNGYGYDVNQSYADTEMDDTQEGHNDDDVGDEHNDNIDPVDQIKHESDDDNGSNHNATIASPQNSHTRFSGDDLELLFKLCRDRSSQLSSKYSNKTSIYDEIAEEIGKISGLRVTGEQCQRKVEYYKYYQPRKRSSAATRLHRLGMLGTHETPANNTEFRQPQHHLCTNQAEMMEIHDRYEDVTMDRRDHAAARYIERIMTRPNGYFRLKLVKLQLDRCDRPLYSVNNTPQLIDRMKLAENRKRKGDVRSLNSSFKPRLPCPNCPKTFSSAALKNFHMKTVHPEPESWYSCTVAGCSVQFLTSVDALERHTRLEHCRDFQYFCSKCYQGFFTEEGLKVHQSKTRGRCSKEVIHQSFEQCISFLGLRNEGLNVHQSKPTGRCSKDVIHQSFQECVSFLGLRNE